MNHYIEKLIHQEESIYLEFKESIDIKSSYGKAKFLREILSLANSPIKTGYLIIGIEDQTKTIVGMNGISEEQIQQIVNEWCRPPITFDFRIERNEGKEIGILKIFPVHQPYTLRKKLGFEESSSSIDPQKRKQGELRTNQVFLRRGSTISEAEPEEIIEMAQKDLPDLADLLSQLSRITEAIEEFTFINTPSPNEPSRIEFSRMNEVTTIAMVTGLARALLWQTNIYLLSLSFMTVSFFCMVASTTVRLTHFGFFRSIVTSILLSAIMGLLLGVVDNSIWADFFNDRNFRIVFGIFTGLIGGILTQLVIGNLERKLRA